MGKIIEASNLPEGSKVYLKKDIFGWRTIQPIKNPDGSINWLNLAIGGWRNFFILIILLIIMGIIMFAYNHDITELQNHYASISENPIEFCKGLYGPSIVDRALPYPDINFTLPIGRVD